MRSELRKVTVWGHNTLNVPERMATGCVAYRIPVVVLFPSSATVLSVVMVQLKCGHRACANDCDLKQLNASLPK